ncbi:hypothetical protein BDF20DRAFT_802094, partial [Mycotypha africana]|uniref:uncharacterized protein n=1 Tax=Mycotypha africana TaxID=64632 RepID=UPI0023013C95
PFLTLPLKVRFVVPAMQALFLENCRLPKHITVSLGSIEDLLEESRTYEKEVLSAVDNAAADLENIKCYICQSEIDVDKECYIECWYCQRFQGHILCLGREWTKPFDLLPIQGQCQNCR